MTSTTRRYVTFLLTSGALSFAAAVAPDRAAALDVEGFNAPDYGGSVTPEGTGTRGGTNVDGAGIGGPRDPARYDPYYNPARIYPSGANAAPGVAVVPPAAAPRQPYVVAPDDPNMNPRDRLGRPQ